jgi:predicted nucleic acid-binding protein
MVQVAIGDAEWLDRMAGWQSSGTMVLAPAHFSVEIANALLRGVRLEATDVATRLDALFRAGIDVIDEGLPAILDAVDLAARHDLTVYDAAYLALALELDADLATLDRSLARAARVEDIPVID